MKKRFIGALLAFLVFASAISPVAMAVTPADPLVASALYSFLVSAGIKLWRDGIEGSDTAIDDLVDDMQTVWGYYKDEEGANVPSWSSIAGITTQNGNIILTHDTAQTFQSFANWLAEYKSMTPGNTYAVSESSGGSSPYQLYTIPANEYQGMDLLNNLVWALPVEVGNYLTYGYGDPESKQYRLTSLSAPGGLGFWIYVSNQYAQPVFCSIDPITATEIRTYPNDDEAEDRIRTFASTQGILRDVSRPNSGSNFVFQYCQIYNVSYLTNDVQGPKNGTNFSESVPLQEMCYVALAGDLVGTGADLFATVGKSVFDKVRDLLDGQSLAIDVGAGVGANEEEIIGAAALGYSVPATAEVQPTAVAYPLPIAGAQELYPQAEAATDVDGLGLPALGKALTSRFPFCIPWDVVYLYQSLNAMPERPVIDIDLFPASFKQRVGIVSDTSFTFDLGDPKYELLLKVVRWTTLVGFVLGLAYTTKRLIWTTGG